jgi:hypothetical protein
MNHFQKFEANLRKQIEEEEKQRAMNEVVVPKEHYKTMLDCLDDIKNLLSEKQKNPKDIFLDNSEFIRLMNISKRTAQHWRDQGYIAYSQINFKIYYRMSDVEKLLKANYKKAFK